MNDEPKVPPDAVAPAQVGDKNTAPNTTAEDDLRTGGQRRVNILWEATQSAIAVSVTCAVLYVSARLILDTRPGETSREAAFLLLSNTFFLVVSVYIQRTNHTKTGGVQKDDAGR